MNKYLDIKPNADEYLRRLDDWFVKDEDADHYAINREVYTDPDLFELEMRHIFEGNWVYVGHESQVKNPHDFLTTYVGRFPVILSRDGKGKLHALLNICSHRGARVCREKSGNQKFHSCPFHGWVYSSGGKLMDVKDEATGAYPASFDRKNLGLKEVARMDVYRGFIFASLNPDVLPLDDYLAGAKLFIDLVADQSPEDELEVLRGATRYTFKGNWKLQAENGVDGYHVTTVHANYLMTTMRRSAGDSSNDTKTIDFSNWDLIDGGSFSFGNGHAMLWTKYDNYEVRPNFEIVEEFERKHGPEKALWMNQRLRNLLLFPNVFLMDQTSTQIRIIRPIAVDETEITTYCIAPKGESQKARALRLRQYEDFFNASGLATPDDLEEFNNCQIGYASGGGLVNELSRGAARWVKGTGDAGKEIGVDSVVSGVRVADEALYVAFYEDWLAFMKAAVKKEIEGA